MSLLGKILSKEVNIMKKNLLLAILPATFITSSVLAAQDPRHSFDGVYIGIGGGFIQSFSDIKQSTSAFDLGTTETTTIPETNNRIGDYFGAGKVYIGIGDQLKPSILYFAAELFGEAASKKNNVTYNAFNQVPTDAVNTFLSTNVKSQLKDFEYGIDLRPGFIINCNTLIYGRAGASFNRLNLSSNTTFNIVDNNTQTSSPNSLSIDDTKNVVGLRLGFGVEHALPCNFAITADYIYTKYFNDVNVNGTANVINTVVPSVTVNGLNNSISSTMTTQTILFGLKYYFGKIKTA